MLLEHKRFWTGDRSEATLLLHFPDRDGDLVVEGQDAAAC